MKKILNHPIFKFIWGSVKVLFVLLLFCYITFIVIQRVSGGKSLFGYRFFTVASNSMHGVYEINDVIAVKDYDTQKLKVGDDVAYLGTRGGLEGKIITHRIIRVEDASDGGKVFVTKGVNAPNEDPAILDRQVLGIVWGKIPLITSINHVVRSQAGFFFLVFVPLVFIIVLEVLQTITDIQIDKQEIQKIKKD